MEQHFQSGKEKKKIRASPSVLTFHYRWVKKKDCLVYIVGMKKSHLNRHLAECNFCAAVAVWTWQVANKSKSSHCHSRHESLWPLGFPPNIFFCKNQEARKTLMFHFFWGGGQLKVNFQNCCYSCNHSPLFTPTRRDAFLTCFRVWKRLGALSLCPKNKPPKKLCSM